MKAFFILPLLLVATSAMAAPDFVPGAECSVEGQRAYQNIAGNTHVYECRSGYWNYLFTMTPPSKW